MPKAIPYTACIKLLALISICWLCIPPGYSQIQEEFLPQVTTLTEVQRRLEMISDNLADADLTLTLADLDDLQAEIDRQENSLVKDQAEQLNRVRMQLGMIRGAVHYYHRRKTAAKKIFQELLKISPEASLDGNIANANLAEYFERIREQIIGTLTVTSVPENAEVWIEDKILGTTPLYATYLNAGDYSVEIRHRGYDSREIPVTIKAGKEFTVEENLDKNSGSCLIITAPAGVTIKLDGEDMGITSGTLSADYQDQIDTSGMDPATLSSPLLLDFVPVGQHEIEFVKSCYRSMKFKMTIDVDQFYFPPIQLNPSYGTLQVTSSPSGARVILADEFVGTTPITLEKACPGEWPVRVELGTPSDWVDTVQIEENQTIMIHAEPRPSLLFLGCASSDPSIIKEGNARIRSWLKSSGKFNLISRKESEMFRFRPLVARLFEDLGELHHQDRIFWQSILETFAMSLDDSNAALYAIAFLNPSETFQPGALFFIHPRHSYPDRLELPPGMPPETVPPRITAALDKPWKVSTLWLGLKVVDTEAGLIILEVDNDGPAVFSVFESGDILLDIDGNEIKDLRNYQNLMLRSDTPRELTIRVKRGDQILNSTLEAVRQPLMMPLSDPLTLYNDILACLEELTVFSEIRDAVYLNIGICHLALGMPSLALEQGFKQSNISPGIGVSSSTLAYLKALANYRAGYFDIVQTLLNEAKLNDLSTFIGPDGPPVVPLAEAGIH